MYELMTLRELPPEGVHPASFDTELEKGRRPQFIAVVSFLITWVVYMCGVLFMKLFYFR